MSDDWPVGTIAGEGRDVQPFRGRVSDIPSGWVIPTGQLLLPDQHEHPSKRGQSWKLPDLTRQIVTGASTHIESAMDDQGKIASVVAANQDMPGSYPLVKIRKN